MNVNRWSRLVCASAFAVALASPARADDDTARVQAWGKELFLAHCASCHGASGRGDGPAAGALKKPPKDLTRIAERNGGVFPQATVEEIIDGQRAEIAHGSRDMPVWGSVFAEEEGVYRGGTRVYAVARYLASIQVEKARPATP